MRSIVAPDAALENSCLIEIYGPNLGKRFELRAAEVRIGRDPSCEIPLDLETISRQHCTLLAGEDGAYAVRDDASTNGTLVNGAEVTEVTPLASGDLLQVGGVVLKFLATGALGSIEAQYHEEIYRLTVIDGLTQLFNKRYLYDFIEREMARCARHGRLMSLVMLDIDHFKQLNDTRGHSAGDAVLRELGEILRKRVRREECVARFGGEEFALVLPETNVESARFFADMLRKLVAGHKFVSNADPVSITISAGVAQLEPSFRHVDAFIAAADARLYSAKRGGRDRVVAG